MTSTQTLTAVVGQSETMILNMGPQHPSTHGVLRLILELDGERVVGARPDIGYLHSGIEKTGENRTYRQVLPYTDRMDYASANTHNLGYVLAVEKLLGIEVPLRAQYIRVLMAELSRVASHLLAIGTAVMDLSGLIGVILMYCFWEREKVLNLFEGAAGSRMTPSYFRIGGLVADLPEGWVDEARAFVRQFPRQLDDIEHVVTRNPIFLERTEGICRLSPDDAIAYGITGPNLRASGVRYDVRKAMPYSGYDRFDFEVPVGEHGDVYDRYLVRVAELRQSTRIIEQALDSLPEGPVNADERKIVLPPREELDTSMEALIHHFKLVTEGFHPPVGQVFLSVEGSKGELGYYIVSDGGTRPYRFRVRAPSFAAVQVLPLIIKGSLLADVVAAIGSLDLVMGEVDR
ncbi:MAG: NADH dehydrogenase (quinone) subunit D [Anaerolineae bacterium]|nr:NADH dehydrogenase (quinone) subunit D [Anaerolineae bacterium]